MKEIFEKIYNIIEKPSESCELKKLSNDSIIFEH